MPPLFVIGSSDKNMSNKNRIDFKINLPRIRKSVPLLLYIKLSPILSGIFNYVWKRGGDRTGAWNIVNPDPDPVIHLPGIVVPGPASQSIGIVG